MEDGQVDEQVDGRHMDGWPDGRNEGWQQNDGQMDGSMTDGGWMVDRWVDTKCMGRWCMDVWIMMNRRWQVDKRVHDR